jgi:hypothetical protein
MSSLTVPKIYLRQELGIPLTAAQGDSNFKTLRDFSDALANLISAQFNTDGTLKDGSVLQSMLGSRSVGQANLAFDSAFFAADTGVANGFQVSFTPALVTYKDGIVLFVRAKNATTGPATLKVDALDAVSIVKNGGQPLGAGDILGKQIFIVAYYGAQWNLVTTLGPTSNGDTGAASTTNFTGLTRFDPDPVALPGNGLFSTFTHGLGQAPSTVRRSLLCNVAGGEFGYAQGDEVPLEEFFDANGKPAFSVAINSTDIIIIQNMAQPYVNKRDAVVGVPAQITEANWQLKVQATKTFNESTIIFPALDIQVANPDGAVSYGKDVFFVNRSRSWGKSNVNRFDQVGRVISRVSQANSITNGNMAIFRLADGVDRLIWTAVEGMYHMILQSPAGINTYSTGVNIQSHHNQKPCWVDEATNGAGNAPVIYCVDSAWATQNIAALRCFKLDTLAGSSAVFGGNLNLLDAAINNIVEFQKWHSVACDILMFSYNPIKKRIYVITSETGFVHVFTVNNNAFAGIGGWWDTTGGRSAAIRAAELTYVKALPFTGGAGNWASASFVKEKYCVEFDLTTGQERSITTTRVVTPNTTGVVTRSPWVE